MVSFLFQSSDYLVVIILTQLQKLNMRYLCRSVIEINWALYNFSVQLTFGNNLFKYQSWGIPRGRRSSFQFDLLSTSILCVFKHLLRTKGAFIAHWWDKNSYLMYWPLCAYCIRIQSLLNIHEQQSGWAWCLLCLNLHFNLCIVKMDKFVLVVRVFADHLCNKYHNPVCQPLCLLVKCVNLSILITVNP